MSRDELKRVTREVVAETTRRKIRDDQRLVSSGLIDSLSVLRLITELESRLHIEVPKNQVQPEDFDSVDMIVETLERVAVL
jgi:acyl carrier protein